MTEIKPWQDRVKPGAFTGVKMEAMLAEIAEHRAAKVEQGEPVAYLYDKIKEVLLNYRLSCLQEEDGDNGYLLVDHLCGGSRSLAVGKHEIDLICDEIYNDVLCKAFTYPVRPMSETTAWLIELNIANAPCWLTGTGAYTNDANEALQFVREIDAKAMLDVYMGAKFGKEIIGIYKRHFAPENYRVTEHIFHGIKGAKE